MLFSSTSQPDFFDHAILTLSVQIASESPTCWKGLEPANEIAALHFARNSIRTMVLYLSENSQEQALDFGDLIIRSARQELSSLVSICLIGEKNRAVGFLHWSVAILAKLLDELRPMIRANPHRTGPSYISL